jgi:cell division septal protein FtsQ
MALLGNYPARKKSPIDYHEKKLENPFYKRREKIISFAGVKGKFAIIISALVLILIFWFIFISHFWVITKISISGIDQLSNDDINNLISQQMHSGNFIIFPQGNLLFFSEKKLQETLQKKYHFQSITIKKQWPNGIAINIISKPIACVWEEGGNYFYADTDGYAVQQINPLDIKNNKYPLIDNESSLKMYNNRIAVDPGYINFAASLYSKFPETIADATVDHLIIDDNTDTIKLLTTAGLTIIFSITDDLGKQLSNLSILKNQKLKDDFSKQKMINLSFGDKIYYQ